MTETFRISLRDMAELALRIVRSDLQKTKSGTPVFVLGYPDGSMRQLPFPAEGAYLLNIGEAKDAIFGHVRDMVRETGAVSVVFASESWFGRQTEAGRALPDEEFLRLSRERGFETAVSLGFMERAEAIMATAQTAEAVIMLSQEFRRMADGSVYSFGEVRTHETPQEQFAGRQKMFGDFDRTSWH
jgi:hypothetical protein